MRPQIAKPFVRVLAATALALFMGTAADVATASAATFNVTTTTQLETAVIDADQSPGANTISLAAGTYAPTSPLDLTSTSGPITIEGPAPVPNVIGSQADVSGNAVVPAFGSVFQVGPGVAATFQNVVVSSGGGSDAGAIDDSGTLIGAGLTLQGNNGPLKIELGATATLTNSTVADAINTGVVDTGTLTLINSDVVNSGVDGIANSGHTLNLKNSIVDGSDNKDCVAPATTTVTSIDGDDSCGVGALGGSSLTFTSSTATLTNGGDTPTYAPAKGSPAIGAATQADCPATDQRGFTRPATGCDIGAVQTAKVTPVFTLGNQTFATTSSSGATETYTPTWTDPTSPIKSTCNPGSGASNFSQSASFPVGKTTVNCTGTDVFGNSASGSFTLTLDLTAPPTIAVPSNITQAATSAQGAVVDYTVTAKDSGGNSLTPSCAPVSGSTFPIATTTVSCSATDSFGDMATKTFTVTVQDESPPTITVPSNLTEAATSASGAPVTYSATASDLVDGAITPTCVPASGSTFPLGATTVTCHATDSHGLSATPKSFTITVNDETPPQINVPAPITAAATSSSGAVVTYTATGSDLVDGAITPSCAPASGSTFPIGTTTVTCHATDSNKLSATPATFTVTVTDAPTVNATGNTANATGPTGAIVMYTVGATDPVDSADTVTIKSCSQAADSTFPVGNTTVTCQYTDDNTGSTTGTLTFTVTVTDTSAPTIAVPGPITAAATSAAGAPVSYTATATDLVDGSITPSCAPASGSEFPVGQTTVTCTVTDNEGLSTSMTFTVTVNPLPITTSSVSSSSSSTATATSTTSTSTSSSGVLGSHTSVPAKVGTISIRSEKTKGNTADVTIACAGTKAEHCKVEVELAPTGKAGKTVFAKESLTLSGGKHETVALKLNGAGVASVHKHHDVELRVVESGGKTLSKQIAFG